MLVFYPCILFLIHISFQICFFIKRKIGITFSFYKRTTHAVWFSHSISTFLNTSAVCVPKEGGKGGAAGFATPSCSPPISCSPPLSSSPCFQELYFLLCCLIFRVDFQIFLRLFQSSSKIQFFLISHNLVKQKALHFFCGCHGNS